MLRSSVVEVGEGVPHPMGRNTLTQLCLNYAFGFAKAPQPSPSRERGERREKMREHTTFASFWPYYLREHSKPRTRALHYIGTTLVIAVALYAIVTGSWLWLIAMPVAGYVFAWIAHWRVEKNRPATFTYPLWSLAADFRMYFMWLSGRLPGELESARVKRPS